MVAFSDKVPKAVQAAATLVEKAVRWGGTCRLNLLVVPVRVASSLTSALRQKLLMLTPLSILRSSFGLKVIPPKPLIAALPKLYDSKAAPVRELAKSLTVRQITRTTND